MKKLYTLVFTLSCLNLFSQKKSDSIIKSDIIVNTEDSPSKNLPDTTKYKAVVNENSFSQEKSDSILNIKGINLKNISDTAKYKSHANNNLLPQKKTDSVDSTNYFKSLIYWSKFKSDKSSFIVSYDISKNIVNNFIPSIQGYKARIEYRKKPWTIELEYGIDDVIKETSHYYFHEKGDYYKIGIGRMKSDWLVYGVGYIISKYNRGEANIDYYSIEWQKEHNSPLPQLSKTIKALQFFGRVYTPLLFGFNFSMGASLFFLESVDKVNNIPYFWIPGMNIEWSENFNSRLNFEYCIEYQFDF